MPIVKHARQSAQLTDSQRENAIRLAHRALVGSPSLKGKLEAWQWLCGLVKGRSPRAVSRLEKQRRLARPS